MTVHLFDESTLPASPSTDLFGFAVDDLDAGTKHYASGVLSPAIFEGYRRAGSPVCVVASEMGSPAMDRAIAYAKAGGQILVDSGAFIWKDAPEAMSWDRVVSNYRALAAAATERLSFVLPDQVGSQEGSLEALSKFGPSILEAIGPGHDALLPIQTGLLSPAEFVHLASEHLTRPFDGVAIPSHAAAFPPADLRLLAELPASIPQRVHFLGISRNSKALRERVWFLKEAWQGAMISCDACLHRAQVGTGKLITEVRRAALEEYWDQELEAWDDTEECPEEALAAARERFPGLDEEGLAAVMASQMGSFFESQILHDRHTKVNGPKATTDSIYHFACS